MRKRHRAAVCPDLRARHRPARGLAESCRHCCCIYGPRQPVPFTPSGARRQLRGLARGPERRCRGGGKSRERGIDWGREVANRVLGWRTADGFSGSYPAFRGGTDVGQWRPTPPLFGPMSAQGLAFTSPFVLVNNTQFQPHPPRALEHWHVYGRLQRCESARPKDRIDAHGRPDGARAVLGGQRQRSLESGGKSDCAGKAPVDVPQQPTLRPSEPGDGRYGLHHLEREAILWSDTDGSDLAPGDRHSPRRHRWESSHRSGRRLAASRRHAVAPGISRRAPGPKRRGSDRPSEPLQ